MTPMPFLPTSAPPSIAPTPPTATERVAVDLAATQAAAQKTADLAALALAMLSASSVDLRPASSGTDGHRDVVFTFASPTTAAADARAFIEAVKRATAK